MSQMSLVQEVAKTQNNKNMKDKFIADLKVDDKLTNFQVVVNSIRKGKTANNKDFIDIIISDKTGELPGKIWEDGINNCDSFEIGDIISLSGKVGEFREKQQVIITFLQKTEDYNLADYLPTADIDVEKVYEKILKEIEAAKNPFTKKLLTSFFKDKEMSKIIKEAPAAEKIHHAYIGGYVEHIGEMLDLAKATSKNYPDLDFDVLLVGILLHDIGKTRELNVKHTIYRTVEGHLIGHLSIGLIMVSDAIGKIKDFPDELRIKILHLIVSHHGRLEYGSPMLPMTREAHALCHIDNLSTKVNIADKYIAKNQEGGQDFSDRHFALESKLYLK